MQAFTTQLDAVLNETDIKVPTLVYWTVHLSTNIWCF
jgi:hypothetical protein